MTPALEGVTLLGVSRDENRAAWEAARRNFIGSSEIAAVMQVSKWQTPLELWCQRTGKTEEWQPSRAARYGTKVEAKILELFAEDHPELEIVPNVGTYVSKKFPHAAATPDAFTIRRDDNDLGITEVKHQGFGFDEWGEDKAPTDAHIQTIWQLGVLALPWGYITAIVGGRANEVIEPRFEFDETARAIFAECLEKAAAFLVCVQRDIPPGAGPGDLKLVQRITEATSRTVVLPKYFNMGLDLYDKAEKKIEALKEMLRQQEHTRDTVLAKMLLASKGAKLGVLPDGRRVRFSRVERSGYNVRPTKYWKVKIIDG